MQGKHLMEKGKMGTNKKDFKVSEEPRFEGKVL